LLANLASFSPPPVEEELNLLRMQVQALAEQLKALREALPQERVVVLREISREQAKEEIRNLFRSGEILYYSGIAEQLGLGLELVVDLCNELEAAGEIGVDERRARADK